MARFLMAGGGTGGHVLPALAVARCLRERDHEVIFAGTRQGLEARLVPEAGFPIEWIPAGGLKRVGLRQTLRSLWQLPAGVGAARRIISRSRCAALFSMGGYVAGPVVLAAWLGRVPFVLLEPNAMPGLTNRLMGRFATRALINLPEAARYFPGEKVEVAGVPVREEFFAVPAKARQPTLTLLITGGSRGSRTLNRAARESWPLFRRSGLALRMLHQTGTEAYEELRREFAASGLEGEVTPFISDMPGAFAAADLVVSRAGASAVAELAAAGKPAILVPFPYAADQHQLRNAESVARAGAARLVRDAEMSGDRLFREVTSLAAEPGALERIKQAARALARPHAARRAAEILEEIATPKC